MSYYTVFLTHAEAAPLYTVLYKQESITPLPPEEITRLRAETRAVLLEKCSMTEQEADTLLTEREPATLRIVREPRPVGQRVVPGKLCENSGKQLPVMIKSPEARRIVRCHCGWEGEPVVVGWVLVDKTRLDVHAIPDHVYDPDALHEAITKIPPGASRAPTQVITEFKPKREPLLFTQEALLTRGWTEEGARKEVVRHAKDADKWFWCWEDRGGPVPRLVYYPPEHVFSMSLPFRRKPPIPTKYELRGVPVFVFMDRLNASQKSGVTAEHLAATPTDGPPYAYVEDDGTYTIADGHHRVMRAHLRGSKGISVIPISDSRKGASDGA